MKKIILTILTALFFTNQINAQLFVKQEIYPGIRTVKGKYYNGSGGGGFWDIAKLDDLGRIIEKEYYYKKELRGRDKFIYNSNNDQLYYIATFSTNNPNRSDTISNYEYKYQGDIITYQKNITSRNDSIVTHLIDSKADTVLIYEKKSYYFRPKTNTTDIYEEIQTLKYKNGKEVQREIFDINRNTTATTFFEYYPNGELKSQKTQRSPDPEFIGVPAKDPLDDMSFEYEFDKFGRVKKRYYIFGTKKYKNATYKYTKR